MKSSFAFAMFASLLLGVCTGCSRQEAKSKGGATSETQVSNMVLVAIGNDALTYKDLIDFIELRLNVDRILRAKRMNIRAEASKKAEFARAGFSGWIERKLMVAEAKRLGLRVEKRAVDEKLNNITNKINAAKNDRKRAEYTKFFTDERIAKLRASFEEELWAKMAQDEICKAAEIVKDEEIDFRFKQVADYNSIAQKTNDLVFAHATNVWKKLSAGGNWSEFVTKYSEEKTIEADGEWTIFSIEELERQGDEIKDIILKLKPGEFTPPIENDGGVNILQLASIEGENEGKPPSYRINRIYFRLPLFYTVPTRDEMIKVVKDFHRNELYQKWLQEAKKKSNIKYPNGENIINSIAMMIGKSTAAQRPNRWEAR